MGPLSWIIIGALVGGIVFAIYKIKAWAQAYALLKQRKVYIYLKKVWGKLRTILKYSNGDEIENEEIKEISDSELYELCEKGEISYDQYIKLKEGKEVYIDVKYP